MKRLGKIIIICTRISLYNTYSVRVNTQLEISTRRDSDCLTLMNSGKPIRNNDPENRLLYLILFTLLITGIAWFQTPLIIYHLTTIASG